MSNIWIETRSGKIFYLLDPNPADVDFANDVAPTLAGVVRFLNVGDRDHESSGVEPFARRRITVARHCVMGAEALEKLGRPVAALAFLLHDAHEAYLGDIIGPVKAAIRSLVPDGADPIACLEVHIDAAIRAAAGIPVGLITEDDEVMVKAMDRTLLFSERDYLRSGRKPPLPWADDQGGRVLIEPKWGNDTADWMDALNRLLVACCLPGVSP
ncbi:MAG: hypothetical protein KGQ37_03685 [Hyphomicrobiales bacterium]|nr:hypothetical protein [Hyphomicrobiales bacterium]